MDKISSFQLYSLLILLIVPVAFFEEGPALTSTLNNKAWLAVLAVLIPGWLLFKLYHYIYRKSTNSFPDLLTEHLGKVPGYVLKLLYIFYFLLACSYVLRIYVEFVKTNLLIRTPISVLIFLVLLIGYIGLKSSLTNIARISEVILIFMVPFFFVIIFAVMHQYFHIDQLKPLYFHSSGKGFTVSILNLCGILGKAFLVLVLVDFLDGNKQKQLKSALNIVLIVFVATISVSLVSIIFTLGSTSVYTLSSPMLSMIRSLRIGYFIQNIEFLFISIWITGIYTSLVIIWFSACISMQKTFKLADYRFLAAPSALVIGCLCILLGENSLSLYIWTIKLMPTLNAIFFIAIPFMLFIKILLKPDKNRKNSQYNPKPNQLPNK